ncbi:MAG: hypothetical protein JO322_11955 [Candidatus Eremiobacteraeota bacterium]|nr:hypothetical protein [Candidatus Eremiobacteraeota bacterium]
MQWFVYHQTNAPAVIFTSGIVVDAVLTTIVSAQAKGDIDGATSAQVWTRVLDRLWAVVIVDFIVTFVSFAGIEILSGGDLGDRIIAIPILLIAAATVFSEAIAVVVDGEQWWFLVVRAIGTSVRTSWSGSTLWRAIVLFAMQFVPTAVSALITSSSTQHHVTVTSFWTDVPLGIVYSIPLDALIVLAFFDASGYEPKRTCGE